MLSEEDKLSVHRNIRDLFPDNSTKPPSSAIEEPASKKRKLDFGEWSDITTEHNIESEMQLYIHRPLAADENCYLLHWWKLHSKEFPFLGSLAKKTFAVPASSASSERNFSAAGQVLTERRTGLLPDNVDPILLLHDCLYKEMVKKEK